MINSQTEVFSKKLNASVGVQWISEEIEAIAAAMKQINETRASPELIVGLLHLKTGIAKGTIAEVLSALTNLEKNWLKPKKVK